MKFSAATLAVVCFTTTTTMNNHHHNHVAEAFSPSFVPRSHHRSSFVVAPLSPRMTKKTATTTTSTATSSSSTPTRPSLSRFSRQSVVTMLVETSGGMEELQELTESSDSKSFLNKQVRKSPSLFKLAAAASIPLSAALGFAAVPSRRIAAHTVGAVLSAVAGAVGKSKLDAVTEGSAKPAIAQALIDNGLDDPTSALQAVKAVQESFGILEEDFEALCGEIYSVYLQGMVKYSPTAKTSELKELEALKQALSLTNLQVGEAHASAAAEWYRTTCLFTPEEELEDPDHPDRKAMDKLLFLTERALRQGGETQEAFRFEFTRVAKALNLTYGAALERVAEVVEPFYQRALKSTRSKLGTNQVSEAMLERARKTLGISDGTAMDMHVAAFNQEVRALLGMPVDDDNASESDFDVATAKFADGASERLDQLKEILGLSETDAQYEITLEATPLYQSTALSAMKSVLAGDKTPEEAWEVMDARRVELLLPEESSKSLISSMVMQALGEPLEQCNKFAKVNNEAATYDNLLEVLEAKQTLIAILHKSGWDEFEAFDETFCNPWDKKSANGFLMSDERIRMYRMFLKRAVRKSPDGKLSDETYAQIMEVKGLLGVTDQQMEIEARAAFGPELQKVLQKATDEIIADYTPELAENMQKEIDNVLESYHLSEAFLREVGASFYAKAVEMVADKCPAGVPTKEMSKALNALRELVKLEKQDTYPSHMEYFGKVYKKSVLEAMGSTGIISAEFRGPLNDLRERLGVSEDDTKELFLEAIEEKMAPMVEWIGTEMERTMLSQQQISQRRGKDVGEDLFQTGKGATGVLGLGAEANIMSDIMNLIDFYSANDIAEEQQTGTKTVEKKVQGEDGEEVVVTEQEPIFETVYPVTALGSGAIDQQMAELLYRQFIVSGFTNPTQGSRYESSRDTFAGILGLDKSKIDEINSNIGSTVYDNFVGNAMKTKGSMDQQDMMFLATLQGKLGLTSEQSERMLADAQKKILSEEINTIMDNPTPDAIRAFREKCNSMGMDLMEDVGISKQRLTRMFESEIVPGLKSGDINAENSEVFVEIQESLGLDPDECESMFEATLMRLSKQAMDLIKGELLRGREENTVDLIKELVRYAAFTDGDLGLEVDEATGNKVFNIYEAFDFSGEDAEQVETNKELLRVAMGLSS